VGRIGPAGRPAWKLQLGTPADPNGDGQAALADHTLYVPSNRFHPGVIAVNAANGKIRWGADIGSRFDLVASTRLLFAIHRGNGGVDVLDSRGGQVLSRIVVPASLGGGAGGFVAGGTFYVLTDEADLIEECRARLRDSVRAHLVADVPVGVLLSGGVDSGTLTALAAELSSEPVRTFSIGFAEQSIDELEGARAVSSRFGDSTLTTSAPASSTVSTASTA